MAQFPPLFFGFWMYRGKNRSAKSFLFISMWSPGWQLSVYHFLSMFLFISTAPIVLLFTCMTCTVGYVIWSSFGVLFSTWHESGVFSLVRADCISWMSMSPHKCASKHVKTHYLPLTLFIYLNWVVYFWWTPFTSVTIKYIGLQYSFVFLHSSWCRCIELHI